MTIIEKVSPAGYTLEDWKDLVQRSAESARHGDFDSVGAGDHTYAKLCEVLRIRENGGVWAILAVWRTVPGISSTMADIWQTEVELDNIPTRLIPLFEAAGHTQTDYWDRVLSFESIIGRGGDAVSGAVQTCASISDDLAVGAERLASAGGTDATSVAELRAMAELYRARAVAYRQQPSETGRYLPDGLLLFDLRQEWLAQLA